MTNLAISAQCNRNCSYCFAMDSLDDMAKNTSFMSMDTYHAALTLIARSGMTEARFLGGEPALHPEFCTMIDTALARKLKIVIFTGGMIPSKVLAKLEQLPEQCLHVLLNLLSPWENQEAQWKKQQQVMQRLGPRLSVGVNIDRPGINLAFIIPLILKYKLARSVRLGVAHPNLRANNTYLHPRHYPEVGLRVIEFALQAQAEHIRLEFDCGWVPCMFPAGGLEILNKTAQEVGLRCNPILDVLPDGNAVSCFPLYDHHKEKIARHDTAADLRRTFSAKQQADRTATLYAACRTCHWYKQSACSGGCLSASLRRLRSAPAIVHWPVKTESDQGHAGD